MARLILALDLMDIVCLLCNGAKQVGERTVVSPINYRDYRMQMKGVSNVATTKRTRAISCCSFCGKSQDKVHRLIGGPGGIFICDECVELCREIIEGEIQPTTGERLGGRHMGQQWEYCLLATARGESPEIAFYGVTTTTRPVVSFDVAMRVLGLSEWELAGVGGGNIGPVYLFKRPIQQGRAIDDATARL